MRRKILVIGASARPLAESVARAGHLPVALDYFGDTDLLKIAKWSSLLDDDAIVRSVLVHNPDAAVFACIVDNAPEVVRELEELGVKSLTSPYEALKRCRDNAILDEVCADNKILRPQNLLAAQQADADKSYLIKPVKSGAGVGIRDFLDKDGLKDGEYLQEKIDGVPISAALVADGNRGVLLGVSEQFIGKKFLGACGYAWCGNIMPFDLRGGQNSQNEQEFISEIKKIIDVLVKNFGLLGACGLDFIYTSDGAIYLLEINPRISASFELVELIQNINIYDTHVKAFNDELPQEPSALIEAPFVGKGIVYAHTDMKARNTQGWSALRRKDIPKNDTNVPAGEPLCTVITPPLATRAQVIEYLEREAKKIWGECA